MYQDLNPRLLEDLVQDLFNGLSSIGWSSIVTIIFYFNYFLQLKKNINVASVHNSCGKIATKYIFVLNNKNETLLLFLRNLKEFMNANEYFVAR